MTSVNHLRILIALAVLKNTPEDQTPSTYISSLKDAFPSFSFKTHDDFWENHARRLEKECVELRATLENLQIRSFLDANADPTVTSTEQTDVSALTSSLESSVPVPSTTGKKKSKKKSESNGGEIVEEDSLADILKQGKTKFGTGKIFQSLDIFLQLWNRHSLPGFPRPAFFIATREVFKALAESFREATKQRANLKSMRMLQIALCSVIDKAVPLVASWLIDDDEALSSLFEHLLDMLINTIIPSFMSVSEHHLAYLRNVDSTASPSGATSSSVADYTDGRVGVLALFQSALIRAWSSLLSSSINRDGDAGCASPDLRALACTDFSVMVHTLILSVIRHLQEILRDGDGHIAQTRFQRIKRLAVKDTFWYLCSVAHFLLGVQDRTPSAIFSKSCEEFDFEPRQKSLLRLLRQTIIDVMEDLVIYQDRIRAAVYAATYGRVSKRSRVPATHGPHDPDCAPSSQSASQLVDYVILDDLEYRMLLRLVECLLGMPLMP